MFYNLATSWIHMVCKWDINRLTIVVDFCRIIDRMETMIALGFEDGSNHILHASPSEG